MNNKEIALSYLRQGLSVIPVTSPQMISPDTPEKEMIEKCKRPLISWKEHQTRLPTEVEVCQWFEQISGCQYWNRDRENLQSGGF